MKGKQKEEEVATAADSLRDSHLLALILLPLCCTVNKNVSSLATRA